MCSSDLRNMVIWHEPRHGRLQHISASKRPPFDQLMQQLSQVEQSRGGQLEPALREAVGGEGVQRGLGHSTPILICDPRSPLLWLHWIFRAGSRLSPAC